MMFSCGMCDYTSKRMYDVRRHKNAVHGHDKIKSKHLEEEYHSKVYENCHGFDTKRSFDIRLKENFKLFVSGPSRCGKTVFVAKLIENIQSFAKQPPTLILYVYKVWQDKYEEMESFGVNFMKDSENIIDNIKSAAQGKPILVVFDDLIGSNSLQKIADMFTVDARHMNISIVFLTQRLFVNDEYFRQISQNSDYFCLFKNPRNSSEIRNLAQQMTPGNMVLVDIYQDATLKPFSYLFINLTQECDSRAKYLSDLFAGNVRVYMQEGKKFKKMIGEGSFKKFKLKEDMKTGIALKEFKPVSQIINSNYITPNQQTQNQNVYFQPMQNIAEKCMACQQEEQLSRQGKELIKKESASTSTNTHQPTNKITQTSRPQYNSVSSGTDMPQHRQIQTLMPQQASMGTETSMYQDGGIQTDQIRYMNTGSNTDEMGNTLAIQTDPVRGSNRGTNTMGNANTIQTDSETNINTMETSEPEYRSQYARQIAAMDTTDNSQQVSLPPIAHQQPMFLPPPSHHQIMQRNQHPIALPPIAHQHSTFVQPPALMGPQQQLALPPPQQQLALPAPQQQLDHVYPRGPLAIEYNPRGIKRANANMRVGDRKKVFLEDERTNSVKRKSKNDGGQKKKKLILDCGKRGQLTWE